MPNGDRVPDWLLERVLLDELPPDRKRAILARVEADPTSAERLRELRASNRAILADYPPARVTAEIERRAAAPEPRKRAARWLGGAGLAAAMAAAAVMLVIAVTGDRQGGAISDRDASIETTRPKGDPHLVIHRKRADEVEPLSRGDEVAAGDRLQLSYVAAGQRYGLVLSIDGRGVVTQHFPDQPIGDQRLSQEQAVPLSHSYELDDAPAFERFVLITSDQPIDIPTVKRRAERLARQPDRVTGRDLDLGPSLTQSWFLLTKVTSP